jgi:hypothetical protein
MVTFMLFKLIMLFALYILFMHFELFQPFLRLNQSLNPFRPSVVPTRTRCWRWYVLCYVLCDDFSILMDAIPFAFHSNLFSNPLYIPNSFALHYHLLSNFICSPIPFALLSHCSHASCDATRTSFMSCCVCTHLFFIPDRSLLPI